MTEGCARFRRQRNIPAQFRLLTPSNVIEGIIMASQHTGEHQMGSMDISEHKASWDVFMKLTTWGSVAVIVLLILMAIFLL